MQQATRRQVLGLLGVGSAAVGAFLDPSRFGVDASLSASVPPGRWPMAGRTPQRSGYQPTSDGPTTDPTVAWEQTVGSGYGFLVASEDTVYVSTDRVSAYAAEDGARRWSQSLPANRTPEEVALWRDRLYVCSTGSAECEIADDCGREHKELYALDAATGAIRWARSGISSVLSVAGATVICGGDEETIGLDAETGGREWQRRCWRPTLVVEDTLACKRYDEGFHEIIAGIDPHSGQEKWRHTDHIWGGAHRPRVVAARGDFIYGTTDDYVFKALDTATETLAWSVDLKFNNIAQVATDGECVYLKDRDSLTNPGAVRLLALDAETGDKQWEQTIEQAGHWGLVLTESALYVPVRGGMLVVDPDSGDDLGRSQPAGENLPRTVIAAGGQVYSFTNHEDEATLYAHR
ncbi:outer membrane protein assembly factor BamB family protein [Halapricum salinum]|uniref:Pyrrolo-quinoline quinone repeat domain-containing protein n=1 Tax=Halapricum salinum TaxID=1457250 RepID=A0A4D6HDM7_9EURY|nr:PQQ-binding-like beta-propeller repeat protein [Halapricum salinum]QCC52073.1 hypothetical protein DV733_12935 [Halapricum salinum]